MLPNIHIYCNIGLINNIHNNWYQDKADKRTDISVCLFVFSSNNTALNFLQCLFLSACLQSWMVCCQSDVKIVDRVVKGWISQFV